MVRFSDNFYLLIVSSYLFMTESIRVLTPLLTPLFGLATQQKPRPQIDWQSWSLRFCPDSKSVGSEPFPRDT